MQVCLICFGFAPLLLLSGCVTTGVYSTADTLDFGQLQGRGGIHNIASRGEESQLHVPGQYILQYGGAIGMPLQLEAGVLFQSYWGVETHLKLDITPPEFTWFDLAETYVRGNQHGDSYRKYILSISHRFPAVEPYAFFQRHQGLDFEWTGLRKLESDFDENLEGFQPHSDYGLGCGLRIRLTEKSSMYPEIRAERFELSRGGESASELAWHLGIGFSVGLKEW